MRVPACGDVGLSSSQQRDLWGRFCTSRPHTSFEVGYSDLKHREEVQDQRVGGRPDAHLKAFDVDPSDIDNRT